MNDAFMEIVSGSQGEVLLKRMGKMCQTFPLGMSIVKLRKRWQEEASKSGNVCFISSTE
jgi:hypothetical protein